MSYTHILITSRSPRERVAIAKYNAERRKATSAIVETTYRILRKVGFCSMVYMAVVHMPAIKMYCLKLMWSGWLKQWGF